MNQTDRHMLADVFPRPARRHAAPAARRNGMIGHARIGSYSTPDGMGHIQRDGRRWTAWRDDLPGITAEYGTMKHAAQYAHYGHSDGDWS